jgi:hypothetical protein
LRHILPESGPPFDCVLVGSELFATAVRAHGSETDAPLTVAAWLERGRVVIEVRGPDGQPVDVTTPGIEDDHASRSLAVVAAVAEVLHVRSGNALLLRAATPAAASGERFRTQESG